MSILARTVERIYRLIIRAYTPEYLETFGDEMQNTFFEGLTEANKQGKSVAFLLREMRDAPTVLLSTYWYGLSQRLTSGIELLQQATTSVDLPPAPPDGRDSWRQFLLEISLFLAFGMFLLILTYVPLDGLRPGWGRDAEFLGRFIVPLTLPFLVFGLARGLPRWTYPLGGLLFGYSGLIAGQTSLWLFLVVMLLAACMLVASAILTDPQPSRLPVSIRRIGQSLTTDWTRLSFGVFGAMPLIILMAYDDAYTNSQTPYFAFSILAMVVSALVYCRSRETNLQITALLAGLTFSICGAWLDTVSFRVGTTNWSMVHNAGIESLVWMAALWLWWAVFILSPLFFILLGKIIRVKRTV